MYKSIIPEQVVSHNMVAMMNSSLPEESQMLLSKQSSSTHLLFLIIYVANIYKCPKDWEITIHSVADDSTFRTSFWISHLQPSFKLLCNFGFSTLCWKFHQIYLLSCWNQRWQPLLCFKLAYLNKSALFPNSQPMSLPNFETLRRVEYGSMADFRHLGISQNACFQNEVN